MGEVLSPDQFAQRYGQQPGAPAAAPSPQPGTMEYYNNFARQPSQALPAPGDPTSFAGQSPAGVVTPGRYDPDTMRALGIDMAVNGGKAAASIINNDPGQQYNRTLANKMADDHAAVLDQQNAIQPVLRRVQNFRNYATQAGPDVLQKATGSNYGGAYVPLPDTSSQGYQVWRQALQHFNPFSDQQSYQKATDTNLEMQHLKDAVSAAFKQMPGSGQGGATDQAQRTVDNMLGHAMNAQDPQTFFRIVHDATNTIRGFAREPDLPDSDAGVPTDSQYGWSAPQSQTQASAPPQSAAPNTSGFKYLGKLP